MKKTLLIIALTTSTALFSTIVNAADVASAKTETNVTRNSDGSYSEKTSVVGKDAEGTIVSNTNEVKSKLDVDGDYKKTIENKTVIDPKGLMNKQTTNTKEEMEKDGSDTSYSYSKKVNGKTVKSEVLKNNKK